VAKGKSKRRSRKQITARQTIARSECSFDKTANSGTSWIRSFGFVAPFAASCIVLYAVIQFLPRFITGPINENSAKTMGLFLNLINIPVSVAGAFVSGGGFTLEVITECTPLFISGLFFCFVVFYPSAINHKVSGLLLGLPAMYLGNLARLVAIFIAGRHDRNIFDVVHAFWGQVFTMLLVVLTCGLWIKSIERAEPQKGITLMGTNFPGRFVVIGSCLFIVWMKVHHGYIWLLDQITLPVFSLFHYEFSFTHNTVVYCHVPGNRDHFIPR
jgi:exosortase/archaeosortase family protein